MEKGALKLFVLVLLAALLVAGSVFFSARITDRFIATAEKATQPDSLKINLDRMLFRLSLTENNIRSYVISGDEKFQFTFEAYLDSLTHDTVLLNNFASDPIAQSKIHLINSLLFKKTNLYAELMSMRYTQVLEETLTNIDSLQKTETTISTPAERKSFFNRLFKARKDREKLLSDSISSSKNTIAQLKDQLKSVSTKSNEKLRSYSDRELFLLKQDEEISILLQNEINDLQRLSVIRIADNVSRVKRSGEELKQQLLVLSSAGIAFLLLLMIAIYRDMQKSRKTRMALNSARIKAEQLTKAKEDFLSDMSHEIRTPLSAVSGLSSILLKKPMHAQRDEFVKAIHQSSSHLLSLLNNLLDEASLQSGALKLSSHPFFAHNILEEVYAILSPKANEKQLQLIIKNTISDSVQLSGDALRLKQILLNLAGNAIKYTDKGTVSMQSDFFPINDHQGILELRIIDTGIGMSIKQQEKLFGRFENKDSQQSESTGLGLFITKSLIDLLKATIDVSSIPNKGTDIIIKIPYPYELIVSERSVENISVTSLRNANILVVDDDEWNRYITKELLKDAGAKPDVAIDGTRALEKIAKEKYDIILLDLLMPDMSGQEVMLKIREKYPDVIIIALTADLLKVNRTQLIASGFTDALLKPLEIDQLTQLLVQLIPDNKLMETQDLVFDLSALKQLTKDDSVALSRFVELFLKNLKAGMESMQDARRDDNPIEMGNIAHRMIPSCKQFKALTVVDILELINTWKSEPPLVENIEPVYSQLMSAVNNLISALDNYQKSLTK